MASTIGSGETAATGGLPPRLKPASSLSPHHFSTGYLSDSSPRSYVQWVLTQRGYEHRLFSASRAFSWLSNPHEKKEVTYTMDATVAASKDDAEALDLMFRGGLDPNSQGKHGQTLLHRAARLGSWKCVKLLLERGADPRVADLDGKTVMHDACWTVHPQFKVVQLLLDRCEALVRATDRFGATPLDYIPPSQWIEWVAFLHTKIDAWWPEHPQPWQEAGSCPYVERAISSARVDSAGDTATTETTGLASSTRSCDVPTLCVKVVPRERDTGRSSSSQSGYSSMDSVETHLAALHEG